MLNESTINSNSSLFIACTCTEQLLCMLQNHIAQWTQITPSLNYVTVRGGGKMERVRGGKTARSLSEHAQKIFFFLLISTQSVAFSYTDFYTTLYFVIQRNYRTLAMQAQTLTRTRYFYSLNVIISHLLVYEDGLGYLSVCAIALRSFRPSHVCICNGHPSSEIFCVHCNAALN
jgi:hypothetical protein